MGQGWAIPRCWALLGHMRALKGAAAQSVVCEQEGLQPSILIDPEERPRGNAENPYVPSLIWFPAFLSCCPPGDLSVASVPCWPLLPRRG